MSQPGYIYVLSNPSANGVVKIGKTQRDPGERAKELSSATGVPTPLYPPGATAICIDGTYRYSNSRRGTYSHHGGVAVWLK